MPDRRQVLQGAVAAAAGVAAAPADAADPPAARNGRIRQSIVFWCFNARAERWDIERTCEVAKLLGVPSVEIVGPEHWPVLRKHGLACAIAPNGMPGAPFMRGFNNTGFHAENLDRTGRMIDACADARVPSVITFVGYKWRNPDDPASGAIPRDEAERNCVAGLKELARHAERKGVTVCLEHLNTRDGSDPMKGHPGYQGDDLDFCTDILKKLGSPRVKLLFDVYHVQLMHGDILRRIEANKDLIGHVHTAGVPGRGELDENQEVNYPAVMRKLLAVGYTGYVGQEFIPTRNPLEGLRQAVRLCDV
ncbi:TIM barrel protein [Urbifossiella limnaea]|uniref:Hydroxypyruvate isomerase n=1 Tax=Urbifossiella limnaea TaxID=2528023 RepID=A0A517Y1X4_9BACT|nr:TIM barrel protein [Urbifossiella limnaea]QDU23734.1 Hydroxypyruvate isomerase [Urbifossiella limnaea]